MPRNSGLHTKGMFGMPSARNGSVFDIQSRSPEPETRNNAPNSGTQGLRGRTPFAERSPGAMTTDIPNQDIGKKCEDLGRLLQREKRQTSNAIAREEHQSRTAIDSNLVLCRLGDEILWLKVTDNVNMGSGSRFRTIGCIGEEGKEILMTAHSGMKTLAPPQGNLLDNTSWTKAVWEFCTLIGHKLPKNCYDHGIEGQFKASHVEVKLMLWFIIYYITNHDTGVLDIGKLRRLKQRLQPLRAVLRLDKDACESCMSFRDELEKLTGIAFEITVVMTVGQTEQVRERSDGPFVNRLVAGGYKPVKDIIGNQHTAGRKEKSTLKKSQGKTCKLPQEFLTEDIDPDPETARFKVTKNPTIQVIIQQTIIVQVADTPSPIPEPKKKQGKQHFRDPPFAPRGPAKKIEKRPSPRSTEKRPSRHNGLLNVADSDKEAFSFHHLDALRKNKDRRKKKNSNTIDTAARAAGFQKMLGQFHSGFNIR